jgi:hypothetical protein
MLLMSKMNSKTSKPPKMAPNLITKLLSGPGCGIALLVRSQALRCIQAVERLDNLSQRA